MKVLACALFVTLAIILADLMADDTYSYAVDAQDRPANMVGDDDNCNRSSFVTSSGLDHFTEWFADDDNDLDFLSVVFEPDGSANYYQACVVPIGILPTDPNGGTPLALSQNEFLEVVLLDDRVVSLYGTEYDRFFVGSNGYITFGSGDTSFQESPQKHFSLPRISALFDWLWPRKGGTIRWKQLDDRVVVTWEDIRKFSYLYLFNTFQVAMFFDGRIEISWLEVDTTDGLAGLSAGTGLPPDFAEADLSNQDFCGPRPPGTPDVSVTTERDKPVTVTLTAVDDGFPDPPGALTYIVTSPPAHQLRDAGDDHLIASADLPYTLVDGGNQVVYQSTGGFSGEDAFQFKGNDGGVPPDGGDSNEANATITIHPILHLPFFDEFPTKREFDLGKWRVVSGAEVHSSAWDPPSPPYTVGFDGYPTGGDEIRTHMIDLSAESDVQVVYAWKRVRHGSGSGSGEDLFIEYLDGADDWRLLTQHFGTDPNSNSFATESISLPKHAMHTCFRLRFRNLALQGDIDDGWFVDNVGVLRSGAPIAFNVSKQATTNKPTDITLNAVDPNGIPLQYTITSQSRTGTLRDPAGGRIMNLPYTLLDNGNTVRFTSNLGFNGTSIFRYQVSNGTHVSNTALVTITVYKVAHFWPLDEDPGWDRTGDWEFGEPSGHGSHDGDPPSAYTGQNVFGYNLLGDYPLYLSPADPLTTLAFDCSDLKETKLRFRRWLGVGGHDNAAIRGSNDGTTWTLIWKHYWGVISDDEWSLKQRDISAVADGQPAVLLRWVMGPIFENETYPGWNIDDIEILGISTSAHPGDCDGDYDVDLADFLSFQTCFTGSVAQGLGTLPPECEGADFDGDGDVDLSDFADFQQAFTGPIPPIASVFIDSLPFPDVPITVSPPDVNDQQAGNTPFNVQTLTGDQITLVAPLTHQDRVFNLWRVNGEEQPSAGHELTLAMHNDTNAVAEYLSIVTINSLGIIDVPIEVSPTDEMGQADGETPFTRTYALDTQVTLTAPLSQGSQVFTHWQLDSVDQPAGQTSLTFTVNDDVQAVAAYVRIRALTVTSNEADVPITVSTPDLNGDSDGTTDFARYYDQADPVTLTAPPTSPGGAAFTRWNVDGYDFPLGDRSISMYMTTDHTVNAAYE